jgi:hypothetical protein
MRSSSTGSPAISPRPTSTPSAPIASARIFGAPPDQTMTTPGMGSFERVKEGELTSLTVCPARFTR